MHFTWPKVTLDTNTVTTTVLRYQVYRSLLPYFEPGDQSSLLPLNQPTGLTYDDLGVVPSTTALLLRAARGQRGRPVRGLEADRQVHFHADAGVAVS